ncbi:carboxypeptidase-like regulatory domain-containing protein [Candidatus Micrarchaeota archaeon]|nr:carboxypeptidase-like regulatory domain-containing protein [Candidatus Micrarchaeota archaeon]
MASAQLRCIPASSATRTWTTNPGWSRQSAGNPASHSNPKRFFTVLLFFACLSFAADDVSITRHLNLATGVTCPGNVLHMNATSSDGTPVPDVEIRLVLYVPYTGFRGLAHTDADGYASLELSKNGSYRIYIYNTTLDHDKYVEFEYPLMCPPPPPKQMNVTVEPDCESLRLNITATKNETGEPLEGVFIQAGNWSSFTGNSGQVSVPFEKDYVYIQAERGNYTKQEFYFDARCLPPPECVTGSDCDGFEFCNAGGNCENITGACGYPENHTWVAYGCCEDSDCGNESMFCGNNTCAMKPLPPEPPEANITNLTNATNAGNATNITNMTNQSNATGNESGPGEEAPAGPCTGLILPMSICVIVVFFKFSAWPAST